MFSAALFMKPESGGRDCVHLSVICCMLLMPLCHMSFYLAAHQPPKSPGAFIIILLRADVCQNVLHFSCIHFICNKPFMYLVEFMTALFTSQKRIYNLLSASKSLQKKKKKS